MSVIEPKNTRADTTVTIINPNASEGGSVGFEFMIDGSNLVVVAI